MTDPRYSGFDGARNRFERIFPGGFHSADYAEGERNYKVEAKARLDETVPLEKAASGSGYGEAVLAVYRATNLLSPFETTRLQNLLRGPHADDFICAAARFTLDGGQANLLSMEEALKPYDNARWTVVTYLPFLWQPDRHMFLKPEVTTHFAERVGHSFAREYEPRLDLPIYESLLDLVKKTEAELAGLEPRDRIDIQSFIWIVEKYPEAEESSARNLKPKSETIDDSLSNGDEVAPLTEEEGSPGDEAAAPNKESEGGSIPGHIISLLRKDGWVISIQKTVPGSSLTINANIRHERVLDGRSFLLKVYEGDHGGDEKTEDIWQSACHRAGMDILSASVRPGAEIERLHTEKIGWTLFTRYDRKKFTASVLDLRRSLPTRAGQPFAYIVAHDSNKGGAPWDGEFDAGTTVDCPVDNESTFREMRPGDAVLYWQREGQEQIGERTALMGTGVILSKDPVADGRGTSQVSTQVIQSFADNPVAGRELADHINSDSWSPRDAVSRLHNGEPEKVSSYLGETGRLGLFDRPNKVADAGDTVATDPVQAVSASNPERPAEEVSRIRVRRDDAERDYDSLGRAPLAMAFAGRLHEIWCTAQGYRSAPHLKPQKHAPAFVGHIDAPWGGGKTTFANLVARVLNPHLDGREKKPAFLASRFPDRDDLSGLFISDTLELGKLKGENGEYLTPPDGRRPWIVVNFNAWRHADVNPPWWCFYQAIRKKCFQSICKDGVPEVRQGTDQSDRGWWQRLWRRLAVKGKEFPDNASDADKAYHTEWERCWRRCLRWSGLWSHELCWRVSRSLWRLVVAIGLVALGLYFWEIGWLAPQQGQPGTNIVRALTTLTGGVVVLWTFATGVMEAAMRSFIPGRQVERDERAFLGSNDPTKRFREHFSNTIERLQRPVLVIIDDLDRCEPEFIGDLARGLQTLFCSPRVVFLILGDRSWVERAFEINHPEMKNLYVESDHTFGGRFVEKIIQLSYVLPVMNHDVQSDYVREVLTGQLQGHNDTDPEDGQSGDLVELENSAAEGEQTKTERVPDPHDEASERKRVRDRLSNARSAEDIERESVELQRESRARALEPRQEETIDNLIREEKIFRRGALREKITAEIHHRLQPLASYLPSNPRHIKRIVNAISMYQESLELMPGELSETKIGGRKWRQLAIGIVLMMRFPRPWACLAQDPDLADEIVQGTGLDSAGVSANGDPHDALAEGRFDSYRGTRASGRQDGSRKGEREETLELLHSNRELVALMKGVEFGGQAGSGDATIEIDGDVVRWLNTIVPIDG